MYAFLRSGWLALTIFLAVCLGGCGCGASTPVNTPSPTPPPPAKHNEWTWENGANTVNQAGVYGNQGVPSLSNVPGARVSPSAWTDSSGKFWLFGGYVSATAVEQGDYNDLWMYNAGEWTWVGGSTAPEQPGIYGTLQVPASSNLPGSRYNAASWTDASGNLWLFGGLGLDSNGTRGDLNDLWEYVPATNTWTWMTGPSTVGQTYSCGNPGIYGSQGVAAPSNTPGSRVNPATWVGATGALWLFGGGGCGSTGVGGVLNDLWKYDPSTNMWTWVDGPNVPDGFGTYGTMGTSAPVNIPGARVGSATWKDALGNLWLFGGEGSDLNGVKCEQAQGALACDLNDLWKYDPLTNMWTWVGGSNVSGQNGVYGTRLTPASANVPGARWLSISWRDSFGKFWLFGGTGYDSIGTNGGHEDLNDLWMYDPTSNMWTWVSGSDIGGQTGTYGIEGVAAPENVPRAREGSAGWIDESGNLWLFGGMNAWDPGGGKFNDMWEYQP